MSNCRVMANTLCITWPDTADWWCRLAQEMVSTNRRGKQNYEIIQNYKIILNVLQNTWAPRRDIKEIYADKSFRTLGVYVFKVYNLWELFSPSTSICHARQQEPLPYSDILLALMQSLKIILGSHLSVPKLIFVVFLGRVLCTPIESLVNYTPSPGPVIMLKID